MCSDVGVHWNRFETVVMREDGVREARMGTSLLYWLLNNVVEG